jgi:ArsR family transcriptional regulator
MGDKEGAGMFRALGDETRLKIVQMLKSGPMCACKLLEKFEITQPTLSYHMKTLVKSGLVFCEKRGVWNFYTLNNDKLKDLSKFTLKGKECHKINLECDSK